MGLRFKFNAVLILAGALGIAGAMALSFRMVQDNATRDIERDVNLMKANVTAVRSYTVTNIDPLLSEDGDVLFQPEAVTSFATRNIFDAVSAAFPEYTYKEAALEPTNPSDLAVGVEREMIEKFRADPDLVSLSAEIDSELGPLLTMAFPITIQNPGCLNCHSTPDVAPPAMVDLYGSENGFGWEFGETVGAQIFTVPRSLIAERAKETATLVGLALLAAFVLVLILSNILLTRVVIRPVSYLTQMAEAVSMGDFSVPEYSRKSRDEIGSLTVSFNRMRRSLDRAMKMIDE